jgi:hypothetical protein
LRQAAVPTAWWRPPPRRGRPRTPQPTLGADRADGRGKATRSASGDRGRSSRLCSTSERCPWAVAAGSSDQGPAEPGASCAAEPVAARRAPSICRRPDRVFHAPARRPQLTVTSRSMYGPSRTLPPIMATREFRFCIPPRAATSRALPDPPEECVWTSSSCPVSSSP